LHKGIQQTHCLYCIQWTMCSDILHISITSCVLLSYTSFLTEVIPKWQWYLHLHVNCMKYKCVKKEIKGREDWVKKGEVEESDKGTIEKLLTESQLSSKDSMLGAGICNKREN
jgi:hypothetical protein